MRALLAADPPPPPRVRAVEPLTAVEREATEVETALREIEARTAREAEARP
jgi:hypothetical protein